MALIFLSSFGLASQKTEGNRASPSAEHIKLKQTFSMKPADKWLASVSSARGILDEIMSVSTKYILLHFTLHKFAHQLMRFLSFAWCMQKWKNSWKLLQHLESICGKNS